MEDAAIVQLWLWLCLVYTLVNAAIAIWLTLEVSRFLYSRWMNCVDWNHKGFADKKLKPRRDTTLQSEEEFLKTMYYALAEAKEEILESHEASEHCWTQHAFSAPDH